MSHEVGIINYGIGNLGSVSAALNFIKQPHFLIESSADFDRATHVILPGVGAFGKGMENLRSRGFDRDIKDLVVAKEKPLLGICLGMQLLATRGFEFGEHEGLNLIEGDVVKLEVGNLRLPHVGWNDLHVIHPNSVFNQDFENQSVYFVHSYHFRTKDPEATAITSDYGMTFAACVSKGRIFGAQFHPEKSQKYGLMMLKKFCELPVC